MTKCLMLISLCLLLGAGCRVLPRQAQVDVPFTPQAPEGNWSEPWQNACEETSVYMVSSFYADDEIKRDEAVQKIRDILATKNETIQVSADESLQTIADLIDTLELPWHAVIKYDPSVDQLKTELADGRPIIVPVFAPELNSPAYQSGGPDYHVLVLTGYDDEEGVFIVNDPGTSGGEGQRFAYDVFMAAIHDLNAQDYDAGQKAVLFTQQDGWEGWLESL